MSIASDKTYVTLEELLASPDAGKFEIVDGHLVEVNVSNLSSEVGAHISALLYMHCHQNQLGRVFNSEQYYRCFADDASKSRKPDASFVSKQRLPADWESLGFLSVPPDLAVEVLSPNDLAYEVDGKIEEYLSADVKLVWEINPIERLVTVHRLDGTVQKLHENDVLSGENVLTGFKCRVGDLLPLRVGA
jgi:Uma2 family endonuclease